MLSRRSEWFQPGAGPSPVDGVVGEGDEGVECRLGALSEDERSRDGLEGADLSSSPNCWNVPTSIGSGLRNSEPVAGSTVSSTSVVTWHVQVPRGLPRESEQVEHDLIEVDRGEELLSR